MPDTADFSSDEGAQAALEAAMAADAATAATEQATYVSEPDTPAGETQSQQVQPTAQPEPTPAAETGDTSLFEGTQVNPDELVAAHPELAPLVKQLEGAFTQKTQTLAEQRQQFEALGDPQTLQQASELYNRIADPRNWKQLHGELGRMMEEYGMVPTTAAEPEPPAPEPEPIAIDTDDPELAQLAKTLNETRTQLRAMQSTQQQREEQARIEQQAQFEQEQELARVTREENLILNTHPHYTDKDMDAIFKLSSFHNGSLTSAQQDYEQLKATWTKAYIDAKTSASTTRTTHPAAASSVRTATAPDPEQTIEELGAELEETIRQMQHAGEFTDSM